MELKKCENVKGYREVRYQKFEEYFYGYALMRCIQTFGTYGFRGIFEKKEYFIKSIPYALNNAKWILENAAPPIDLPELYRVLKELISSKRKN